MKPSASLPQLPPSGPSPSSGTASGPGLLRAAVADSDLLRAFAARRDEAAFRELAERYAGLVYGIAFRRLGDAGLAQEVASEVFTLLARKASRLTEPGCLAAWLQRSAVLVTANAARRETRRRLAMNAYAASLDSDVSFSTSTASSTSTAPSGTGSTTEDPAWQDALAHLDESLARLPERDRQLLLARFFAGRNHGEIAAATGAREETVKKAGQRALQKLRTLLIRRGVTLSAAALASGLPGHVRAAGAAVARAGARAGARALPPVGGLPEGLAGQVSASALRAAESLPFFQSVQHSITYMFYGKTLTATAAALLLCAALGGGSFLAARQLAVAFSGPPPGTAGALTSRQATAADSAKSAAPDKTAARSVTDIVGEAVSLLRRSRKEGSPEMDRAILLLAGLSTEQMREAAGAAESYREDRQLAEALATALGAAWGEQEPAAALAWLETFPGPPEWSIGPGADKVALSWFDRDGRVAWNWWKARRQQSGPPLPSFWEENIVGEGMGNWARRNPYAATSALGEVEASPGLMRGFASQLRQLSPAADSPAIDAAMKWKNPSMRMRLAMNLADGLDPFGPMTQELDRIFPVLNRLCGDQPGAIEVAAAPLMKRWVAETPEKAVEWILTETAPTSANTRLLMEPALQAWGDKAPSEAWQWIQEKITADPAQAERFYGALLDADACPRPNDGTMVDRCPSDAWAKQIASSSPESRDAFLHYWAGQWLTFANLEGVPVDEVLTRWRRQIATMETYENPSRARMAKQALQMAEKTAAVTTPAADYSPAASLGSAPAPTTATVLPQ